MLVDILLLLAGVFLIFLLDDVMNLGVVKHIEAVKHLNVSTTSTAYHTPAHIKVHPNWGDTSCCHQPPYSLLHLIVLTINSVVNHRHI